jgi:ABC-type Mn2+/Zn2+ transport system ATPase subunit
VTAIQPSAEPGSHAAAGPIEAAEPGRHDLAVRLRDVTAGYDGQPALQGVDLDIASGSLLAIFGPNGGGKTTLLKLIAGILKPWTGTVEVLGAPAGETAHRIAYVPQAELVDWSFPITVSDVVMMGRFPNLGPLRQPGPADRAAVAAALERVGMADNARTQIGRLSGGQRRRAFLARAVAAQPDLYLLDEPVTGVDVPTQEDLMTLLSAEADAGRTIIATTHDLAAVGRHFRQAVAINRGVVASGGVDIVQDSDVLSRTYGGHLLVLGDRAVLLDDAHHHDAPSGREQHFHEDRR